MQEIYQNLAKAQLLQLEELTRKIADSVKTDLIICFGSHTSHYQDWSVFHNVQYGVDSYHTSYDLFVVVNADEKKERAGIIQMAEQHAEKIGIRATVVVQGTGYFIETVQAGHRFSSFVYSKGFKLYDSGEIEWPHVVMPSAEAIKQDADEQWAHNFTVANAFLKSATHCLEDENPKQATFNLHQCLQHTYMAVIRSFTGYRSTSHNLSRLMSIIEIFSFDFSTIFPGFTKEENELFDLLNRSYSDARYNEAFVVSTDVVKILLRRTEESMAIAKEIYEGSLEKQNDLNVIQFPIQKGKQSKVA
jgi:HEPN domain-containing protein